MDRQCQCGVEGEGTVGGGDTKSGCVEATVQKHRFHREVKKDAVKMKKKMCSVRIEDAPG